MKQKSIFVCVLLYIAVLCIPQYAAAQSYSVSRGEIYKEEGMASWYGPDFDGRPTASGEIFNSTLFTAAHPNLPFGTMLVVTNKQNNRQVTVKVNDRGPFVAGRIIDLSKAAAEHIDMIQAGAVPVIIETMPANYYQPPVVQPAPQPVVIPEPVPEPVVIKAPEPEAPPPAPLNAQPAPAEMPYPPLPPITVTVYAQPQLQPQAAPEPAPQAYYPPPQMLPPAQPQATPYPPVAELPPPQAAPAYESLPPVNSGAKLIPAISPLPDKLYRLQIGSYKVPRNAVEAFEKLKAAGLTPTYEQNGEFYRVVVAGIRGTEVQSVAQKLEKAGFNEALIRAEN